MWAHSEGLQNILQARKRSAALVFKPARTLTRFISRRVSAFKTSSSFDVLLHHSGFGRPQSFPWAQPPSLELLGFLCSGVAHIAKWFINILIMRLPRLRLQKFQCVNLIFPTSCLPPFSAAGAAQEMASDDPLDRDILEKLRVILDMICMITWLTFSQLTLVPVRLLWILCWSLRMHSTS